jgi:hypothetical protein
VPSRNGPRSEQTLLSGPASSVPPELGCAVDEWASSQSDEPSRSEAIRRLVEIGLKAKK